MNELPDFSIDRLEELFRSQDWNYAIDKDGDLRASFDYVEFLFCHIGKKGEVLDVRVKWSVLAPFDAREQLIDACNEWNRTKLFPKAYISVNDEGSVLTHGEFTRDYELGVSDKHLEYDAKTAISTGLAFIEFLNDRFPDTRFDA